MEYLHQVSFAIGILGVLFIGFCVASSRPRFAVTCTAIRSSLNAELGLENSYKSSTP